MGAASANPALHVWGGGVDGGISLLIGFVPRFPDENGGNWHGLELRDLAGAYGAGVVYSDDNGAGLLSASLTAFVNYEFLHFFRAAPHYDQNGIGFSIGPRIGVQYTDILGNKQSDEVDPTLGANASLVFPRFKAETHQFSSGLFNLGVWTLPGTSVTFFSVGGGAAF